MLYASISGLISVTLGWCLPCVVLLSLQHAAKADDPASFNLAEAKEQWAKGRSLGSSYHGTSRAKMVYSLRPSPDWVDTEDQWKLKQNAGGVSIQYTSGDVTHKQYLEFVRAANSKYAFKIRRPVGSPDWVIEQLDIGGDGSQITPGAPLTLRETARATVCQHFRIWDNQFTLERLFERPNFRTTRVSRVHVGESDLIRIDFECPYPIEKRKEPGFHPVQSGHLILDPQHYWCINECGYRSNDSVTVRDVQIKFEYAEGLERFPILRRIVTKQNGFDQTGKALFTTETEATYDLHEVKNEFDDIEFTLSHYGLPEPVGIIWKKRTPTYIWLLAAAGGCVVLAMGFFFVARRYRKASGQ